MEEFPGNSQREKAVSKEPAEPKQIEKVVSSKAVRRKKPLGKRFIETFFGESAKNAVEYVAREVLLPAVKDTIADAFSQGIERMIFGEARSASRRTGSRPGSKTSDYVSYNRMSSRSTAPWNRGEDHDVPRTVSRRARASHDFDEIVLATRHEANMVLDRLMDLISKYNEATVADFYTLVDITGEFTDDRWGWDDLRGVGVSRVREGYILDLPRPQPLDR